MRLIPAYPCLFKFTIGGFKIIMEFPSVDKEAVPVCPVAVEKMPV